MAKKSASNTQFRHRMRCNRTRKCGHRFTLKKKPFAGEEIKCAMCGGNTYSCEASRRKERAKQVRCLCYNIPFPHEKGSILGCEFHWKDPDDWTLEDQRQFQGMMETPRSG